MNHYRVIEKEEGLGVLQKKVQSGGISTWGNVMNIPHRIDNVASKKYVNDKIKEANPDFKGTYNSMTDIEAIEPVNANDWAYLVTLDENGNDVYNRYRYTIPSGETSYRWVFEVAIKRDNFTDDEWAAITSGINSGLVEKLEGIDVDASIAEVINSIDIDEENSGDITVSYEDGEEERNEE